MNQRLFQLSSFITYWLDSVDEHSLHSPFFFNLYVNVIKASRRRVPVDDIEHYREQLLNSTARIQVTDYGAGSNHFKGSVRDVRVIAQRSLTPRKYATLYRALVTHFKAQNVIELGTSLGITTLYLSPPGTNTKTFEGSEEIAAIARRIFEEARYKNIEVITGNIDETLPSQIDAVNSVDLVFMDAFHRYDATMRYFGLLLGKLHSKSIVIVDDIHYSGEMERAWNEVKTHDRVHATADLYRCGLVFFDPSLNRQHVVLDF